MHNGNKYNVVAEPLPCGKFITRVDPPGGTGRYIRQPDTEITDPQTLRTIKKQGAPVEFDTEKGALDAGEDNIKLGVI